MGLPHEERIRPPTFPLTDHVELLLERAEVTEALEGCLRHGTSLEIRT